MDITKNAVKQYHFKPKKKGKEPMIGEFKFEGVVVQRHDPSHPNATTPYMKLWRKLMKMMGQGWDVHYEEYEAVRLIKYRGGGFTKRNVIMCRGTATIKETKHV